MSSSGTDEAEHLDTTTAEQVAACNDPLARAAYALVVAEQVIAGLPSGPTATTRSTPTGPQRRFSPDQAPRQHRSTANS